MTLHHSPHVAHLPCSLRGKGQSKKRRSACVPTGNFQGNRQRKKYAPCHPLVAACGTSDAVWNNFFNVRAIVILSSHPPVVSYLPYIQSQIIQVNKRLVVSDQWDVFCVEIPFPHLWMWSAVEWGVAGGTCVEVSEHCLHHSLVLTFAIPGVPLKKKHFFLKTSKIEVKWNKSGCSSCIC